MDVKTAVLVDGSFFIRRLVTYQRRYFGNQEPLSGEQMVGILTGHIRKHLSNRGPNDRFIHHLYRIFIYDSEPLDLSIHYPVPRKGETNRRMVNFSKDPESQQRINFLSLLKKQRKVALRLGHIKHHKNWALRTSSLKSLLAGELQIADLEPEHFYFECEQKGVDVKLGIDIASLSYERHVDQIVLIAGDSDFVPAAKLARRKGIDFVLDALKNDIDPSLDEHIDGLNSYDLVNTMRSVLDVEPDVKPSWWDDDKSEKAKRPTSTRKNSRGRKPKAN